MAKVSVIIPARNEKYLIPTISDVLSKAAGDVEVVAVLEDCGKANFIPSEQEWKAAQAQWGAKLTTIYHTQSKGMRPAINAAAASAISRGAKYLFKLDAHCSVAQGWDETLKADCDKDWIVVPRRKRLDPTTWTLQDVGKPDVDYHYLSFPDDPNDFGGPGLNGKVWYERIKARLDKPEYEIDDEMSSQGSAWFMHAEYFTRMGFMDTKSYGPFWNEFQELGLSCWLSGGQVKVNKRTWYAHWHKGRAGRGYHLPESWLKMGRNFTMNWLYNEANPRQTRPFKWIIEHFAPVPGWPEGWEGQVYTGPNRSKIALPAQRKEVVQQHGEKVQDSPSLRIHAAYYGIGDSPEKSIDVTAKLQSMVKDDSLDLMVGNSTLGVGNPFRGQKKSLRVRYSFNGGEQVVTIKDERDWLIIGQSSRYESQLFQAPEVQVLPVEAVAVFANEQTGNVTPLFTPTALNDFLIRKFNIPSHRLRGPMPIEVNFHRNDLAQLFAELGFNKGAEIGVAEGKYSEVLLQANPELELLCVDPWGRYEGNAQQKSDSKHDFARSETRRRIAGTKAQMIAKTSMRALEDVEDGSLDFVYIDANHSYDYFMEDIVGWNRKVRIGGIIAGDDVYRLDPKRWGAGPMEGIYDYTRAHKIEPWFLIAAHRSVDFFFVKGDWK